MTPLYRRPEVLAFLQDAKEHPNDDSPRLILADWLEEHDDPSRAEFIKIQCLLTSGANPAPSPSEQAALSRREEQLLTRHGGAWAGPLWNWRPTEYAWRRGLLAVRLARPLGDVDELQDVLDWMDRLHVEVHGWRMLNQAVDLLNRGTFNHLALTLRRSFPESQVLECLRQVRESPCLRTLTFWCVRPAGRRRAGEGTSKAALRPTSAFLSRLVRDLPLGQYLTHLGVGPRPTPEEASLIRDLGLELLNPQDLDWME